MSCQENIATDILKTSYKNSVISAHGQLLDQNQVTGYSLESQVQVKQDKPPTGQACMVCVWQQEAEANNRVAEGPKRGTQNCLMEYCQAICIPQLFIYLKNLIDHSPPRPSFRHQRGHIKQNGKGLYSQRACVLKEKQMYSIIPDTRCAKEGKGE